MNTTNLIDPYRQNVALMKKFFSSPVTLLIAVLNCMFILTSAVTSVILTQSFNIFSIISPALYATAFFLFYFNARSDKPFVSFNPPIILLKVITIISIVLDSIGILCFLVASLLIFCVPEVNYLFGNSLLPILLMSFPLCLVSLIQSIAFLILIGSFKKSTTTVFLYKKGAMFTGVTTLLKAVVSIATTVLTVMFTPALIQQLYNSLKDIASLYNGQFDIALSQLSVPTETYMFSTAITSSIQILISILIAVFAFLYYRYISKLSDSLVESPKTTAEQQPVSVNSAPVSQPIVEPVNQPVNFDPKPVFVKTQAPADNTPNSAGNPYAQSINAQPPADLVCPRCGTRCPASTVFCCNCGAKLY